MAYYDIAQLTGDGDFMERCMACYASEPGHDQTPSAWWAEHVWEIAASPGFGDAYASAVTKPVDRPGRDPAVISDAQILAAVQALPKET